MDTDDNYSGTLNEVPLVVSGDGQIIRLLAVAGLQRATTTGAPPLHLVDARTKAEYAEGHIPGAVLMEWEDWCEPAPPSAGTQLAEPGYWGKLADPIAGDAQGKLSQCGLNQSVPIVVYANGVKSKGRDGRIAWMLLYYGASQVFLLDGGWQRWCEAGGAVETDSTPPAPGSFNLQLRSERRIALTELAPSTEHTGRSDYQLVDTRGRAEFKGECYDYQPRTGRLPDAVLFPFQDYYEPNGDFARRATYLAKKPAPIGDATIVSYCEVGVRAATMALLHEIYTGQIVRVYDGSVMEWAHHRQLPMVDG